MSKNIESIKHTKDKRVHIPSKEEAGYEDANTKVQTGKKVLELPKNPVVHRGQDPELFWLNKYGNDDRDDLLRVDIRSLYRHEHIAPERIISGLYSVVSNQSQIDLFSVNELFGNALEKDEIEKVSEYYEHQDGWTNRLIQGDSHLVMASLLEREGMAGQVQCIYMDPPYGIKYGSNWQIKLNNRDVKDGNDEALTGEPEQIKAFRDTWELGIHSYLSYLRDRLLIAKELLTESGSCFVQISDENVHLVRSVMDEVFGSDNFICMISYTTSSGFTSNYLSRAGDYILWYARSADKLKYRQIYVEKASPFEDNKSRYNQVELPNGIRRAITKEERNDINLLEKGTKVFTVGAIDSQGTNGEDTPFDFEGRTFRPAKGRHWTCNYPNGLESLKKKKRLIIQGNTLSFVRYHSDFPFQTINNLWSDIGGAVMSRSDGKKFVVQTGTSILERCLLMTSDPGDLILDPTCGSGTTAFVAEQFGRRWITIDTSRIALNIAKQRLMTAVFPYYKLYSEASSQSSVASHQSSVAGKPELTTDKQKLTTDNRKLTADIRQGFLYKTVPHITLKSLANDEPPSTETLYDKPEVDNKRLRVSGPFTVETLQNFEPISPEELDDSQLSDDSGKFEEVIKQHLVSAGIKNGRKDEMVVFRSVELLAGEALHAEGFYQTSKGEEKAYFYIGPKFGTVSKKLVSDAIKECRQKGDANWLVILGFSFESDIEGSTQTMSMGNFEVTKARIHDDLLQEGLKKKPAKSAASFVTIGEPDISVAGSQWIVDSSNQKICTYEQFKKLSGLNSLAEINGLGREHLSSDKIVSERGTIRAYQPNAKVSSEYSIEHSRRTIAELQRRVSAVSGNSDGVARGIGNTDSHQSASGLSDRNAESTYSENMSGSGQNAEWAEILNKIKSLTPENLPLTTSNWLQVTIEGLDIYDPIRDEVKARNVHEIAYWMIDDDYDGSNFVVKQVFFCGGDKSEFNKWKKGLSDLAQQETRRNAERTLRIEIDSEAFERLYGHISHPIEIKKPNQKIAVRIISQFGEESTKVLEIK